MDSKKIIAVLAVLLIASFAVAGVVTYLSNTVNGQVTTASPIELTASALNAYSEPVALDAISAYSGETITIVTDAENLSNVAQNGVYTVVISPEINLVGYGNVTELTITGTEITALATEHLETPLTLGNNEPAVYSFTVTYETA